MAQHDYIISNQTFPSYRNDHNNSLSAIVSNNSGTSTPSTTYAYQWWYDSTNNILKIRNADNDAWINFATFDQTNDRFSLAVHDITATGSGLIPSGSIMLFQQTSAPVGWTKLTTQNNKALRVVSGSAGTGGSTSFTSAFNSNQTVSGTTGGSTVTITGSVGSHTLTISEIPSHSHFTLNSGNGFPNQVSANGALTKTTNSNGGAGNNDYVSFGVSAQANQSPSQSIGGSGGHTHNVGSLSGASHTHGFSTTFNQDVQYVDIILAQKS